MKNQDHLRPILSELENILSSHNKLHDLSFLEMQEGILRYRVGYDTGAPSPLNRPLKLCISESPDGIPSLASSALPMPIDLSDRPSPGQADLPHKIFDSLAACRVEEEALSVYGSAELIQQLQQDIIGLMDSTKLSISSFSTNQFMNVHDYSLTGEVLDISTICVPSEYKHYTQDPSAQSKQLTVKSKINLHSSPKSEREILEELKILKNLPQAEIEAVDPTQVLSLNNLAAYTTLWEQMLLRLGLKQTGLEPKQPAPLSDDINESIDRVVKEATPYAKVTIEQTEDVVEIEEENAKEIKTAEKREKQGKDDLEAAGTNFEYIKIEKKKELLRDPKYPMAIQDESDVTNFYEDLPLDQWAMKYPFQLDQFQKRSIYHLHNKQTVFVAAHTSAGKTVVAEYAIALAQQHKRKVIYTSPIKALSNQKFRQLSLKFKDVGIITGDVSINQQAFCVIMTTEILRNLLYKGADMIRDIEWVIFDEVHYINNAERGGVWEETIIMLPDHIGLVMLSATVPNCLEFANWVGRTKKRIVYVMKTLHRPVPLEHSLFIFGKFHLLKEPNGPFLIDGYRDLLNQIKHANNTAQATKQALKQAKKEKIETRGFYNDARQEQRLRLLNKRAVDKFIKRISKADMENASGKEEFRQLESLIDHCNEHELLPCVVFIFSKRKINALAEKLSSRVLTNRKQQFEITSTIGRALSTLKPEDQQIEQFLFITALCQAGYAIHHGDLLPLAKQIIQILFSKGLIKVLLVTETFAMGINMPTKTVIFQDIKKNTNGILRMLNSSEYVQMSGRAGRRGLDAKGTVIIVGKDAQGLPDQLALAKMIDNQGEPLLSKFRITYGIILNLFNSQSLEVKEMMRQSFLQNPKFSMINSNISRLSQLKINYQSLGDFNCPFNQLGTRLIIQEYLQIAEQLHIANEETFNIINSQLPKKSAPFPKFALLLGHNQQVQHCIILRVDWEKKSNFNRILQVLTIQEIHTGLYLTKEEYLQYEQNNPKKKRAILEYERSERHETGPIPGTNNQYHYFVFWVAPSEILDIYSNRIQCKSNDPQKQTFEEISKNLIKLPILQSITVEHESMAIRNSLSANLFQKQCHKCDLKEAHTYQFQQRTQVYSEIKTAMKNVDPNELGQIGDVEGMFKFLDEFAFVNMDTLTLKGRIALEIDDVYLAEIILNAVLEPLDPPELAALLSGFQCDYRPLPPRAADRSLHDDIIDDSKEPIPNHRCFSFRLLDAMEKSVKIVRKMRNDEVKLGCYFTDTEEELIIEVLNFHLAQAIYQWASGFDFVDIKGEIKVPEGVIVRTIMRLSMLLGKLKVVSKLIGSTELERKITEASNSIKRDVIFCQSLYLSEF